MKKLYLLLFFFICIVSAQAQPWLKNLENKSGSPGFYEIQKAFNDYRATHTPEKGDGEKPFRRWEWFWEQRLMPNGDFPPTNINYAELEKFISKSVLNKKAATKTYWSFMGPETTPGGYNGLGRLNCIAFHPTDSNTMWVGSPGGGIWKTTDMGKTWKVLSDYNGVLGVSSIVVNPNHPDSIYIATGDGDRGSLHGLTGSNTGGDNKSIGVLLSDDGGKSWKPTGNSWSISDLKLIRKIIMNPNNTKQLFFASSDGVYVTQDAGASWTRKQAGYFMDIAFMPDNPSVIYATTYAYNGNASVFRSTDTGLSFNSILTLKNASRIAMATTLQNPSKLVLLVADEDKGRFGGLYESIDTGASFELIYDTTKLNILSNRYNGKGSSGQGWYDLAITLAPDDEDHITIGGVNLWESKDGGKSFTINTMWTGNFNTNPDTVQVTHADKHSLDYNPLTGNLFDCNDGGVYYSTNKGKSWSDLSNGLGIMQFYRFSIIESDTGMVLAGAQDNGTKLFRNGIWEESTGGDGMDCVIDPVDPTTYYTGIQYGKLNRVDPNGVTVISDNIPQKPKGAWVTPYVLDPNDHKTLYAGYKAIYKSTDQGETWLPICDSLWKPNFVRNIVVSEENSDYIYAADYSKIYKTINGGQSWTFVTSTTLPITNIKIHPKNKDIIYYTVASYVASAKVYRINTTETGVNKINNLSYDLPNVAINCIVLDKDTREGKYIGTDVGVFYSDTSMGYWELINNNLPNLVVTELEINYTHRLLYAATFGRGVWKTKIANNKNLIGPIITSLEPGDNSSRIHPNSQLIINFDKAIKKGNGIITIRENNQITQTINVSSDSVQIEFAIRAVVTPAPFNLGKNISVQFPAGTFIDDLNQPHKGILNNQDWNFSTTTDAQTGTEILPGKIKILPNPSKGLVKIANLGNSVVENVKVYDFSGKELMDVNCLNYDDCTIDLRAFSSGIYHLRLSIDGILYFRKMILNNN